VLPLPLSAGRRGTGRSYDDRWHAATTTTTTTSTTTTT
jgi:hypothetical protein